MYANVLGSIDLFFIGMIGCRLMSYLPQNIKMRTIRIYKIVLIVILLICSTIFSGWLNDLHSDIPLLTAMISKLNRIYYFIGPYFFSYIALILAVICSYFTDNQIVIRGWRICDSVAQYTFMFYLWHSILLADVANKLNIENPYLHYIAMVGIGFIVTMYVAYLMTKMNIVIARKQ